MNKLAWLVCPNVAFGTEATITKYLGTNSYNYFSERYGDCDDSISYYEAEVVGENGQPAEYAQGIKEVLTLDENDWCEYGAFDTMEGYFRTQRHRNLHLMVTGCLMQKGGIDAESLACL